MAVEGVPGLSVACSYIASCEIEETNELSNPLKTVFKTFCVPATSDFPGRRRHSPTCWGWEEALHCCCEFPKQICHILVHTNSNALVSTFQNLIFDIFYYIFGLSYQEFLHGFYITYVPVFLFSVTFVLRCPRQYPSLL